MSEVTLVLNETQYIIDKQLLIKHSQFLKDLINNYPDKKEFKLTFPIKSLDKFIDYMNDKTSNDSLDYDEFLTHQYLDTKNYFDHLIYLMVEEGPNHGKIKSLHDDLSWEIYNHLPLNMVPEELLTYTFVERYKKTVLPQYPKSVNIIRCEEKIITQVLIRGNYITDAIYRTYDGNAEEGLFGRYDKPGVIYAKFGVSKS